MVKVIRADTLADLEAAINVFLSGKTVISISVLELRLDREYAAIVAYS